MAAGFARFIEGPQSMPATRLDSWVEQMSGLSGVKAGHAAFIPFVATNVSR